MKKLIRISIFIIFVALGIQQSPSVSAADPFPGRIIDDAIFDNSSSMSEAQIQNFINAFPSSCLLPQNYPGGLSPITFNEPIDYFTYGGNTSAARVIWKSSQLYGLNPQVILATLEKEQNLVTGNAGCAVWKYNSAIGYNCPDGSENALKNYPNIQIFNTCVAKESNAGFSRQVNHASWQFKFDKERAYGNVYWGDSGDHAVWYVGRMTQGDRKRNYAEAQTTYYDGYTTIDGQGIYLSNGATASLYNFTPHFNNFGTIFTGWFGSATVPAYDYEFVSSSAAFINLDYGQETANNITIKNTGNTIWYADGSVPAGKHPTRLSLPDYGLTAFADTSDPNWLGTQGQIKMSPAVVNPGENAIFNFRLKAPNSSISQTTTFVPVVDSVKFMKNINMQFIIKSSLPKYSYVSSSFAPTQLMPGQKFTSNVVLKNTGNGPWYADGSVPAGKSGMRLASLNYITNPFADTSDPNWLGTQGQIKMSPAVVNPGENAVFSFSLAGPAQKTNHNFRFLPVLDGISFLQDYGMAFQLSSPGQIYSYQFVSVAGQPTIMSPGASVTTALSLRNTGNVTWKNETTRTGSQTSLRLVMAKQWYRSSLFYDATDPNWITAAQISMTTSEVAPGQIGTFTFNWKAPMTKGTYIEYFAPVADGVTLLQDIDMGYKVTVQ